MLNSLVTAYKLAFYSDTVIDIFKFLLQEKKLLYNKLIIPQCMHIKCRIEMGSLILILHVRPLQCI